MTQVTGLTAERMQEIIDDTIASGEIVDGNLILSKYNGSQIDLGSVGGVAKETFFPTIPAPEDGDLVIRIDLPGDPLYKYTDGVWELQPRMGAQAIPRVKVRKTAAQSIPNGGASSTLAFDIEDRDTDGMHDNVTNNSRLTAKTPGIYIVKAGAAFVANTSGTRQLLVTKTTVGGVTTTEMMIEIPATASSGTADLSVSGLVEMSAGDYVEAKVYQNSGGALDMSAGDFSHTFEAAWIGGAGQTVDERGVPSVQCTASAQSIPDSVDTVVAWATEVFDTDNMHDTVTNNTRLVAKTPGLYSVFAGLRYTQNASGLRDVALKKSDGTIFARKRDGGPSGVFQAAVSVAAQIYLAAGEYVEVLAWQNSGGALSTIAIADSRCGMTLIGSGKTVTPYALAYKNATQSIPNTTDTIVAFPAETSDNDAIHDVVTNNSRLTARTGGVYVILGWVAYDINNTGMRDVLIKKNGSTTLSRVGQMSVSGEITQLNVIAVVELAVGDYVELQVYQNSGAARTLQSGANLSGFSITKIGGPNGLGSGLGAVQADMYTVATLPAATAFPNGRIVGVSDGAGGQQARMAMNGAWINLG